MVCYPFDALADVRAEEIIMTIRQLRPEQKKLWRRIYLQEMDRGIGAEKAAKEADLTITQWEARGAFEPPTPTSTPQPIDVGVDDLVRAGNLIVGVTVRTAPSGAYTFKGDLVDEVATGRRWYSVETRALKDGDIFWCVAFDSTCEDECPAHDAMAALRNARPGCEAMGLFNMKTPPPALKA